MTIVVFASKAQKVMLSCEDALSLCSPSEDLTYVRYAAFFSGFAGLLYNVNH